MNYKLLNKILSFTAAIIALIIIIGTITTFTIKKGTLQKTYRRADPDPQKIVNMNKNKEDAVDAWTDFKQIRTQTKKESEDIESVVIVISPWFTYSAEDKILFEELSQKERQIRSIFINYFTEFTYKEILSKGEIKIKEELLDRINSQLVIGKIRAVYFNDYIFIE